MHACKVCGRKKEMINALTIDLEPWTAFYDDAPLRMSVDKGELTKATLWLLDVLDEHGVHATFFVLGVVFEWFPGLIEKIRSRGHEIAFHGYSHVKLNGNSLKDEIERSQDFLDRYNVKGFRAPRMSINLRQIKILSLADFLYDSSTYGSFNPSSIWHGMREISVSAYPVRKNSLTFPRTFKDTLRNFEVPIGSGLLIGLLSSRMLDRMILEINRQGQPFVLFIHPWQLTGIPEVKIGRLVKGPSKIFYIHKISEEKLRHLLENHNFVTIQELLTNWLDGNQILQKNRMPAD